MMTNHSSSSNDDPENQTTTNTKPSNKQSIASSEVLSQHNALPIYVDTKNSHASGMDQDTSSSCTCIGIKINNWEIKTSSSTIANENEMDDLTLKVENLANQMTAVDLDYDTSNDKGQEEDQVVNRNRRLCIPEIVFLQAFVHLKFERENLSHEHESANNGKEIPCIDLMFNAADALGEWASCHTKLDDGGTHGTKDTTTSSSSSSLQEYSSKDASNKSSSDNCSIYRGVSIIKSVDAKLWAKKRNNGSNKTNTSNSCFGQNINVTSQFNYDWTFSTPYTGSTTINCNNANIHNLEWKESTSSLIDFELLTDQTQPILYYDDINLFEDDMHDNGYVSLRCKIRVMPTCFYILISLFVRVDHVLLRVKEVRMFSKFQENSVENKRIKYIVCKDITWKECKWDQLNQLTLPPYVGSWRIEDENGGPIVQQRIQGMLRKLPVVDLPHGMIKHSYVEV